MTPRKLKRALREHTSQRGAAQFLGVNPYYISRYLRLGEEPTNPDIRQRMGFPKLRKPHDGRSGFTELPEWVQWWRKLRKEIRDEWVKSSYEIAQAKARRY